MYRIVAGKLKGRKVVAPKQFEVRPTTDFAKEGLFSMLSHSYTLQDIHFLDLFAGIGSISLEMASRGCTKITAVEANIKHTKFIIETIQNFQIESVIHVIRQDVFEFLKKNHSNFDLIFADPPFDLPMEQYEELIGLGMQQLNSTVDSSFILEHASRFGWEQHPNYIKSRKFGNITFSFFK